jgi:pyrimidine operon attenuation protein/uracil phosphoribosyltransferase
MKQIADPHSIAEKLTTLASDIHQDCPDPADLIIIGIQRRGAQLGERLAGIIGKKTGLEIPLGILDITFYRDDLSMVAQQPIVHSTEIRNNLDDKYVVLVDDVIYTGRTIRAALDALVDFGRAKVVRLAILVDRGWRELPIQPDYTGWTVETTREQVVHVTVSELDGEDAAVLKDGEL